MKYSILIALLAGCPDKDKDKDREDSGNEQPDPVTCDPVETPTLLIGQGSAGEFTLLQDGDPVTLDVAPQGGYGVSVRARTTGLSTEGTVDVLLETALEGVNSGSFVNKGTQLYCQDDGTGLLWGVVVGFSQDTFPSPDALLALDGEPATLIVEATDSSGESARGEVEVIIEVGG